MRRRPDVLRVVVSAAERAAIEQRAADTGMSVSAYLRKVGIGHEPRSMADRLTVLDLVRINADQGRLGGLLKLWLVERPGQGASDVEVRRLLQQIEDTQVELRRLVQRL